jgi:hypothetical protein
LWQGINSSASLATIPTAARLSTAAQHLMSAAVTAAEAVLAAVRLAGICAAAHSEQLSKHAAFFHFHTPPTQGCRPKAEYSKHSTQEQQHGVPGGTCSSFKAAHGRRWYSVTALRLILANSVLWQQSA